MKVNKLHRMIILCLTGMSLLSACGSTPQEVKSVATEHALYLRGDMNDYSVSETYRLKSSAQGLCTEAALHADWSPYHFKFADPDWTSGSNYGYAMPPGVLEMHSRDVKLNPDSRFEDLTLKIRSDGIYRFCLIKKSDGYYASVSKVADGDEKNFATNLK